MKREVINLFADVADLRANYRLAKILYIFKQQSKQVRLLAPRRVRGGWRRVRGKKYQVGKACSERASWATAGRAPPWPRVAPS